MRRQPCPPARPIFYYNIHEINTSIRPVASLPGGGVRWRPKRGPSRVGWCVCVGKGITIVSGPGGGSFEPPDPPPPGYGPEYAWKCPIQTQCGYVI